MNFHEAQRVPSACSARGGSSPDVRFSSEPRIRCEPSEAMLSVSRTSRSGKFEGRDSEPGDQPGNCYLTPLFFDDYHSPLRSRFYRSGGTTQQIASSPTDDCARV